MWCGGVVSVSSFEVVFCESDVCFRSVVVLTCNGGLEDYRCSLSGRVFFCLQLQVLLPFVFVLFVMRRGAFKRVCCD